MHVVRNALPAVHSKSGRGVSNAAVAVMHALTLESVAPPSAREDTLLADAVGQRQSKAFASMPKYPKKSVREGLKKKVRNHAQVLVKAPPQKPPQFEIRRGVPKSASKSPKRETNWVDVKPKAKQASKKNKTRVEGWIEEDWGVDSEFPQSQCVVPF